MSDLDVQILEKIKEHIKRGDACVECWKWLGKIKHQTIRWCFGCKVKMFFSFITGGEKMTKLKLEPKFNKRGKVVK